MPKYLIEGNGLRIKRTAKDTDTAIKRLYKKNPALKNQPIYIVEVQQ